MNRCAIVATHHKTGTAWMGGTFTAICSALDISFLKLRNADPPPQSSMHPPLVLFQPHSNFDGSEWLLESPEYRVLHLIRDPRDVIISAMHYHRVAKERQLHVRRRKFGDLTYQEKI